jgi:hypothetical protein
MRQTHFFRKVFVRCFYFYFYLFCNLGYMPDRHRPPGQPAQRANSSKSLKKVSFAVVPSCLVSHGCMADRQLGRTATDTATASCYPADDWDPQTYLRRQFRTRCDPGFTLIAITDSSQHRYIHTRTRAAVLQVHEAQAPASTQCSLVPMATSNPLLVPR